MGMFSESVDVVCALSGQPLELGLGRPALHRLRRTGPLVRAPPNGGLKSSGRHWAAGPGLVDHEIWRVQVRRADSPDSESLTLDLTRHVGSGRWRLLRIHDALLPSGSPNQHELHPSPCLHRLQCPLRGLLAG